MQHPPVMQQKQALDGSSILSRQIFHVSFTNRAFSKIPTNGGNQRLIKNIIVALRSTPIHYKRDNIIFCEGDSSDYILWVASGVVRSCKTFRDGSRSVAAFHLPGEFIGWNGDLKHSFATEAATDTMVLFFKKNALLSLASRDTQIAKFLLAETINELERAREYSLLITRKSKYRVAAFLTQLSRRAGTSKDLDLHISRQDIADHLGIRIETLSRIITAFERLGIISRVSQRGLTLQNLRSLMQIVA